MKEFKVNFTITSLSKEVLSDFFKKNDDHYFKKLSERIDIDAYAEKLNKNAIHFTLYENERLIGLSSCYFNNKIDTNGYISSLTIVEGYRGFGLGSQLLIQIKEYAEKNNYNNIKVKTQCDNKVSINFYKKNTFVEFAQDKKTSICTLKYAIK